MSLLRRLDTRAAGVGVYNQYVTPFQLMYGQTSAGSSAGERVDEITALGLSGVMRCVALLADTVASLPIRTYQVQRGRRTLITTPDVLVTPDPESNIFELVHTTMASLALHGNAYLLIDRDVRHAPIGLLPLHPYQMQVVPSADANSRAYLHLGNPLDIENLAHIRWFTPPQSLVGVSPLIQNRQLLGLALAMDKYLAQFYGEGATPSSVLESDRDMTPEQARSLQATWEAQHRKHRRPAVLTGGLKWRPVQQSAADSQMIETREQIIRDVARVFGVPAALIGGMGDSQTYQNVEQANLNFLTHTITPWLRRLEIAFSRILPPGTDVAFDTAGILRTDALTRARVGQLHIMSGTRTPNELRVTDGLDPYSGGDVFHQAMQGTVTAGGDLPTLGTDASPTPTMGVIDG